MASEKITSILDAVKELSILEFSELVSAIEKFGVSAAMVVAGGGGALQLKKMAVKNKLVHCYAERSWFSEDPGHQSCS